MAGEKRKLEEDAQDGDVLERLIERIKQLEEVKIENEERIKNLEQINIDNRVRRLECVNAVQRVNADRQIDWRLQRLEALLRWRPASPNRRDPEPAEPARSTTLSEAKKTFFDLPREVRDYIYQYCVNARTTEKVLRDHAICLHRHPNPEHRYNTHAVQGLVMSRPPPVNMMLTSRQMKTEVMETFAVSTKLTLFLHFHRDTMGLGLPIKFDHVFLSKLRDVTVYLWSLGPYGVEALRLLRQFLNACPDLRTMDITYGHVSNTRSIPDAVKPILLHAPFERFVSLRLICLNRKSTYCPPMKVYRRPAGHLAPPHIEVHWTRALGSNMWTDGNGNSIQK